MSTGIFMDKSIRAAASDVILTLPSKSCERRKDEAASRPPEFHDELRIADHALEYHSVFLLRFLPFSQKEQIGPFLRFPGV